MPAVLRRKTGYRYLLKAHIHAAGYRSQVDFARAAGLDVAELSRILHGLNPTKPGLRKIAATLRLSVSEVEEML